MKKTIKALSTAISTLILVCILCALSGTLAWILYPHIHALFPNAVEKGILAKNLSWWDSVCITWLFGILFRSSTSKNKGE